MKDLKLKEVEDFRHQVGELIQGAWEGELSDEDAEKRYKLISELVKKLDEKPQQYLWVPPTSGASRCSTSAAT